MHKLFGNGRQLLQYHIESDTVLSVVFIIADLSADYVVQVVCIAV